MGRYDRSGLQANMVSDEHGYGGGGSLYGEIAQGKPVLHGVRLMAGNEE